MKTILLILGSQTGKIAAGDYNKGLFKIVQEQLGKTFDVITTKIEEGYDVVEEITKWKKSDFIIYQYPIYWFMMPPILKKYLDDVYAYGEFFAYHDGPYGSGGLMKGKKVMLSTTWNSPEDAFGGDFFEGANQNTVLLPMRISQTYCGMGELPHFSCHDIVKNPNFEVDKKRYIEHLKTVFAI